jgi:hypothetical protein
VDSQDPFGGGPENWTRVRKPDYAECPLCGALHAKDPWPPTDPDELEQLNRWMDEQEAAHGPDDIGLVPPTM